METKRSCESLSQHEKTSAELNNKLIIIIIHLGKIQSHQHNNAPSSYFRNFKTITKYYSTEKIAIFIS